MRGVLYRKLPQINTRYELSYIQYQVYFYHFTLLWIYNDFVSSLYSLVFNTTYASKLPHKVKTQYLQI